MLKSFGTNIFFIIFTYRKVMEIIMAVIKIDLSNTVKNMKPMHGGGQPPIRGAANFCDFHYMTEAGIPYSRLHDVAGCFGAGKYVDIPNIFRNFDADETNPDNYDFTYTDLLIKNIIEAKLATNTGISKNYFTVIETEASSIPAQPGEGGGEGTDTPAIETYESKLPVVYITTEGGVKITSKEDYVNATMKIQGNDTYTDSEILYDGEIEIRGRGNSTWNMPKKPYKIKLDKKSNIFDMGKHKHWVLLANYSDASLMRNTLAYNLSGSLGMPQMETVWVDVDHL